MTARGNLKEDNDSLLLWSAMTRGGNTDTAQPNSAPGVFSQAAQLPSYLRTG